MQLQPQRSRASAPSKYSFFGGKGIFTVYSWWSTNPLIAVLHPAEDKVECPFFPYNIIHIKNSTNNYYNNNTLHALDGS